MPKVKIDRVLSFSTEDHIHVAANILSTDTGKKWKCAKPGEKSCSVVLQLEKASVITSIDIGNEHSAYIEVLANRSGGDGDYKVLLVMSAFMSPLESRQSQNINKVRMFTQDQLSKPECEQKWDQIKVVCTQPFNKQVQYGLSFVTLHASEDKAASSHATHLGKFAIRPESPDNLSIGSLFARRKEKESNTPKKAAAAIRDASLNPCTPRNKTTVIKKPTGTTKVTDSEKVEVKNRNRNEIMYTKEDDDVNEKIDTLIEKKKKEDTEKRLLEEQEAETKKKKEAKTPKKATDKTPKRNKDESSKKTAVPERKQIEERASGSDTIRKRKSEDITNKHKRAKPSKPSKPFRELLNGVTLVISGIQNPERGNIRTQALSMGAKYKPDWDNTSTHLICAFPNTPKFNQVKGKGKIVRKEWIIDSYSQRKRLPWRRYALDPSDQGQDESEQEIEEETARIESPVFTAGGSDTEDEIERIQLAQKRNAKDEDEISPPRRMEVDEPSIEIEDAPLMENNDCDNNNRMDQVETEKKEPVKENYKLPKLATFFERRTFYIDNELSEPVKKRLNKYIVAYKGEILENIAEADNILSEEDCVEALKASHSVAGMYLLPDWVWDCHNNKKIMPMDDFIL